VTTKPCPICPAPIRSDDMETISCTRCRVAHHAPRFWRSRPIQEWVDYLTWIYEKGRAGSRVHLRDLPTVRRTTMPDQLSRLLLVTLEASRLKTSLPVLDALRSWLDSWCGIGAIERGMARQGYDQLTRYDQRGWRATFYTTGMEHSPTSATGTGWERSPWHAVQRAAWEALKQAEHYPRDDRHWSALPVLGTGGVGYCSENRSVDTWNHGQLVKSRCQSIFIVARVSAALMITRSLGPPVEAATAGS
jgi:hypothetical protein